MPMLDARFKVNFDASVNLVLVTSSKIFDDFPSPIHLQSSVFVQILLPGSVYITGPGLTK